ncbi:MAG: hypothetical protein RLN90_09615 [Balneolaceae bacterium]
MPINRKRLKEYLEELGKLQDDVGDIQFVKVFEQRLLDALARELLNVDDVEFLIQEIDRLFTVDLSGFDTQILTKYNEVLELVNELYDDLGSDVARQFQQLQALEQVNRLQLREYKDSTVEAIAKAVSKGVKEEFNFADLVAEIKPISDKAETYAETLARTQVKRYSRQSKLQKAELAGVNIFVYVGSRGVNTRDFCNELLGVRFSLEQIQRLDNRNLNPPIINGGGWNCVHEFEPDPTASEPDAEAEAIVQRWLKAG